MTHPSYPTAEEIIKLMKEPSKADRELIQKAYAFAEKAHEGQKRYSGEPYFNHVAHVGANLAGIHVDTATVAAGILHDTLEDAGVTAETIATEEEKEAEATGTTGGEEVTEKSTLSWWIIIVVVLVAIAAVVTWMIIQKKRR